VTAEVAWPVGLVWVCGAGVLLTIRATAIVAILIAARSFAAEAPQTPRLAPRGSYFGAPVDGLSASDAKRFERGARLFTKVWTPQAGLGPDYSAMSCVQCHSNPMSGGSTAGESGFAVHVPETNDLAAGHVFSTFVLAPNGAVSTRPAPLGAVRRRAPALFGSGLFDLVPEASLHEIADPIDRDADGISGRLAPMAGRHARYGSKASVSSLEQFIHVALAAEMGLTTSTFRCDPRVAKPCSAPPEVNADDVGALRDFVRFLAPPPRGTQAGAERGRLVFDSIGCAACHRPTLPVKGPDGSAHVIDAYTDLLLHDMGPTLEDPFEQGAATRREFRTAPLWGVAPTGPPYLHDGRAQDLSAAIEAHDGEGAASRMRFRALAPGDVRALLAFLRSL
jgi:CxxC motif-containing protein (DUF1111 family)